MQEAGWGIYSILNRKKKAAASDGVKSMQILPSTTDTDAGFTVKREARPIEKMR